MPTYAVTTRETVYEIYTVEADSPGAAKAIVADPATRSHLKSYALDAPGDDIEVVGVEAGA